MHRFFLSLPTARPERFLYVNHPPTLFWIQFAIVEAFGLSERTLRVFPAVATAVGHGLLGAALLRSAGLRVAIAAVAILFVDRMSFVFGWMAGYEGPVLCAMIGAAWANEKRIDCGKGRMKVAAFIAMATAVDWAGSFILPALMVGESLRPKAVRRFGDFVPAAIGVGLVVLADIAWVIWVRGGPSAAIQAFRAAAADANALGEASRGAWFLAQWANLRLGHGDVLLGAALRRFFGASQNPASIARHDG